MARLIFVCLAVVGCIYKAECAAPTIWTEPNLTGGADDAPLATTVPENTAVGQLAVTIVATGATEYTLHDQQVAGMFTIDNGGILSLASGTLDYEDQPTYTLTVAGGDGSGGTATITTTLSITNVNEAPTFTSATYNVSAVTGSAAGTTIYTVTATDVDAGTTVTYAITGGNTNTDFDLAAATGVITVAAGKSLDKETTPSYSLTVTGDDGSLTATTTVSITVGNSAVRVTTMGLLGVLAFMLLFIM